MHVSQKRQTVWETLTLHFVNFVSGSVFFLHSRKKSHTRNCLSVAQFQFFLRLFSIMHYDAQWKSCISWCIILHLIFLWCDMWYIPSCLSNFCRELSYFTEDFLLTKSAFFVSILDAKSLFLAESLVSRDEDDLKFVASSLRSRECSLFWLRRPHMPFKSFLAGEKGYEKDRICCTKKRFRWC